MATGFKEPVDSLDDFDDVSLRAIGLSAEALAALGAKPIALPAEEVYEALERNTIQAWSGFPFDTASQASLGEIAPYVVDLGIGVFSVAAQPAVNLDTWNSLSDEQKSLLEDVAEDFPAAAIEIATKEETEACEVFKSAGGSVIELSGEDVDQWAKEQHDRLMQSWLDATVEAGVEESVAVEFQEQFMAAVAKYEGQTGYTSGLATCAAG